MESELKYTLYPTAANTVQITVQIYNDIYTEENLSAAFVKKKNCHIIALSLTIFFTTAVG